MDGSSGADLSPQRNQGLQRNSCRPIEAGAGLATLGSQIHLNIIVANAKRFRILGVATIHNNSSVSLRIELVGIEERIAFDLGEVHDDID